MLYSSVAVVQVSPDSGTNHALQLVGSPACVGASGMGLAAEEAGEIDEAEIIVLVGVTGTEAEKAEEEEDGAVPTQYASSAQKPVEQSDETAGFHAKNWATVIPYLVATVVHVSSVCTTYQLLQSAGSPDWVAAGGVRLVAAEEADVGYTDDAKDVVAFAPEEAMPTQYASSTQKPVEQSEETVGFHAKNWATVITYSAATAVHVSSICTTYQLLQSAGSPDWVGPGGDATVVVVVALPSSGTVSLARSG